MYLYTSNMKNKCDIMPQSLISVLITCLTILILLFLDPNMIILNFMLLSVLISIISTFLSIFLVNKYIYRMKNNYNIMPEFILSIIIAYFLFLAILFQEVIIVDQEIIIQSGLQCSIFIGIISVFASAFLVDKFFQRKRKYSLPATNDN